jgi:CRISPR-associated endonuclease/helicase Cas3
VRPLDRDRIINQLKDLKLFAQPRRGALEKPVILISTQTLEAGADLDLDRLITEIAPLDCLRQRFGRLDRLGEQGNTRAVILVHKKAANDWKTVERIYGQAARSTADWLEEVTDDRGEIDFGIEAFEPRLRKLAAGESQLDSLLARRSNAPVLLPVYADLWAKTSPEPAATPEPALFLHGPQIDRDLQVVWRADIDVDDLAAANVSLDMCPPSALEALSLPAWAVQHWLSRRDDASLADVVETTPDEAEEQSAPESFCLRYNGDRPEGERWTKIKSGAVKPGDRIVVPCKIGGCDEWGWNPRSKDNVEDLGAEAHYLHRLKGVLRITRETLGNALRRGQRDDETESVWGVIARELGGVGADPPEPQYLIEGPVASERLLPKSWEVLIEGRDNRKGIKDRWPRVAPFRDMDWSKGCVLYAEKALDAGLLRGDIEDEPDGAEAVTARDDSSRIVEAVSLTAHLVHVERKARAFAMGSGLDGHLVELVGLSARLHDLGKAEPRFQADIYGASALIRSGLAELQLGILLAKSARGEGRRGSIRAVPENFRHEALSVALAARHPAVTKLDDDDRDLVLWLIGTHHGFGRPFFPPMVDDAPATKVVVPETVVGTPLHAQAAEAPIRLDQGWLERAERLVRRFGPWELARLEAILRLADHAASRSEQEGFEDVQEAIDNAEAVS